MIKVDLTTRSNAIAVLLGLTVGFALLSVGAYLLPHVNPKLAEFCVAGFGTFSSTLLLSLKMETNAPPPADSQQGK